MLEARDAAAEARPPGTAVAVQDVCMDFRSRSGRVSALHNLSFSVPRSQFVSLLGPSGCGKSTLLRLIDGLVLPTAGRVIVEGTPVLGPQTQIGFVFQSPVLLEWRSALGNVLLQAEAHGLPREAAEHRAKELLAQVGLAGFERSRPRELSGGMQQRVSICRALLHDPELVLMDEPFGALDALTRDQMAIDLQRLWLSGRKTIVFVTHSVEEAVLLSDRVLVMSPRPGRVLLDLLIDLPRPRRLALKETTSFGEYAGEIRRALSATGILHED